MRTLDLDPYITEAARQMESGAAGANDRFMHRLRGADGEKLYDTVTWTLPDGTVEEWSNEHNVEVLEYTVQAQKRYLARTYPANR